ncbi:MAG: LamG domain-containing protein [Candidatus Marsarchaeota archaeon]|nr:LamG domain-containing protein [Candidatus Marsarchaeota archaeon]
MAQRVRRAQSAMEYLMTYGWAILIIAVVLGALFQLGVFNSSTFSPKAPPGACQVYRPSGPGSTININLEGVCNGELPQYVAQFNGQTANIVASVAGLPTGSQQLTVTAWFNNNGPATYRELFWYGSPICPGGEVGLRITSTSVSPDFWCTTTPIPVTLADGTWYFVAVLYTGTKQQGYVGHGGQITEGGDDVFGGNVVSAPFYIGYGNDGGFFQGQISNVQIYNTSLSANEIQYLYTEGIGGVPVTLQYLVGWWPLNGNANDYSGNNNNGVPSGVTYTNQWTSGYTAP